MGFSEQTPLLFCIKVWLSQHLKPADWACRCIMAMKNALWFYYLLVELVYCAFTVDTRSTSLHWKKKINKKNRHTDGVNLGKKENIWFISTLYSQQLLVAPSKKMRREGLEGGLITAQKKICLSLRSKNKNLFSITALWSIVNTPPDCFSAWYTGENGGGGRIITHLVGISG